MLNSRYAEELNRLVRAIGDTPPSIYYPSDDSYLMLETLTSLPLRGKTVLDVGTGSGILALFCAMKGAEVTVTDIDELALQHAARAARILGVSVKTRLSDIFSNVSESFELVLFNPPYLHSSALDDTTVDGGPRGISLSDRFLQNLANYLAPDGTAILLVSSLNEPPALMAKHPEFAFTVLGSQKLFFEELQVLGIRFRENFPG